jgi:hypothetical protein
LMRLATVIKFAPEKLEPLTKCCSLKCNCRARLRRSAEANQNEGTENRQVT